MDQQGITLWFTGLSGAGKTTIALHLEERLQQMGIRVKRLDGDEVRARLAPDLGFTKKDRYTHIERVAYVADLLTRYGVIVLASFISPYREMRQLCREQISSFAEVYVNCPLEECIHRDVKGLYARALKGEIPHFTGISDPYEPPVTPELTLDSKRETPEESANRVMDFLRKEGYIPSQTPNENEVR
ncbi:adenylyl-sulfate kinase [Marininema halotolerans]|uniref:Adenylyl-sulfate kinase n=1 Tax=Marininema halotolerans TaxID=1155944 RepID=A0A1I6R800_9BACL|nr:adenylyl-sulfate kinase [Marininema halotolerans]SFS60834.1 adenylylsulfate kinase [Marininema halotolerans]